MGNKPGAPVKQVKAAKGGSRFEDEWSLGKQLGEGNFGKVFVCAHRRTKTVAAVKIVSYQHLDKRDRRNLEDEISILAKLDHPNIVRLHQVYWTQSSVYIVQELCEGGELFDRIVERKRYSEHDARELVRLLLGAVAYAHSKGVVHRDLKPENVLLSKGSDTNVKLADWGLAKAMEGISPMKTVCGSPAYMAPEVVDQGLGGSKGYDEKSDVWAIGVITYILLAGFNPFDDPLMPRMLARIRKAYYTLDPRAFAHVSQHAQDLIKSVLVRDPVKRLTARACLEHPWFHVEGSTLMAHDLAGVKERLKESNARRRFRAAANAVRLANRLSVMSSGRSLSAGSTGSSSELAASSSDLSVGSCDTRPVTVGQSSSDASLESLPSMAGRGSGSNLNLAGRDEPDNRSAVVEAGKSGGLDLVVMAQKDPDLNLAGSAETAGKGRQ